MNLLDALPSLTRISGSTGLQNVQITFNPPLSPEIRTQIATQSAAQPFTLTVSSASGNQLTFTLPSGTTLTATVNPPLPLGTQLQLNIAEVLPGTAPQTAPAAQAPIQARILPAPTPNLPQTGQHTTSIQSPTTQFPSPNSQLPIPNAPSLTLTLPAGPTAAVLTNILTTTLLQQTTPTPSSQSPIPNPQLPVPAGPIAVSLPATLTPSLISQPLTLTPTAPMQPNGTQTATLTTPNTPPVPVVLSLGVPLPVRQPQPAMLLPATAPGTTQPTLVLTAPTTNIPQTPAQTLTIQHPTLNSHSPIPNSQNPIPTPQPPIPMAGRILPPTPNQPPQTQTALLANGTTLTLKTPQPLPTGSIIVADFPITPTSTVQRVLTPDAQSQPQPNTTQTQTAVPVAPQLKQAVLAPGMVVEGTITGQNESGQPLLTLTQPPALAGQVAPLTLTDAATLLPLGARLSIRVENNLAATILGLTLPPQTQAAYTVGTIGARWEGLQQALQTLQQQAPMQAANLRASLPQLANLLPGLLAFTNALRTRNPEDAFDTQATRLLKSMGIDLTSDISQLSQLQQRPSTPDPQWRGTLFPYVEAPGEDPRQGGFFWRREKSDNPRSPTSTRFVVELEMSRMGAMQLDGLVTYPEIWLKLRRTTVPEADFTPGLQSLVTQLLTEYGLTGGIAVETTATFPVNPRAELLSQTENPLPTSA